MTDFWPSGIELQNMQSPLEILQEAQRDWESNSNELMTLVLQSAKSETGNEMIIVHAKHVPSNRTATLFAVVHRPASPYPATIQPKDDQVPNFLKKTYYQPGFDSIVPMAMSRSVMDTEGRTIDNYWVSDTPTEFRSKLKEVFNLGIVKSEMLNLTCKVMTPENGEEDASPIDHQD